MAAVDVTISGILYDKLARTTQQVVLVGEASLTGIGIGGGPIYPVPPDKPPIQQPPGQPAFPIVLPPGSWPPGGGAPGPGYPPSAEHPIVIPPPGWTPPGNGDGFTPPPPGSTVPVGPPLQPTHPIVVPDFILVNYPGFGWVAVGKPVPPTEE